MVEAHQANCSECKRGQCAPHAAAGIADHKATREAGRHPARRIDASDLGSAFMSVNLDASSLIP